MSNQIGGCSSPSSSSSVCLKPIADNNTVPETPELKPRDEENGLIAETGIKRKSSKRLMISSDDENSVCDELGTMAFAGNSNGKIDFERSTRNEISLSKMTKLFPGEDLILVQDALRRSNWDTERASEILRSGRRNKKPRRIAVFFDSDSDSKDVECTKSSSTSSLECISEIREPWDEDREIPVKLSRNGIRTISISSEDDGEVELISDKFNPIIARKHSGLNFRFLSPKKFNGRVNKFKQKKEKKRKVIVGSESEGEEYQNDDLVYFSSSDDDDEMETRAKVSTAKKAKQDERKLQMKARIISFLQTGVLGDLLGVQGVSRKKAETLIQLRPFNDWDDLVQKLENHKSVSPEILNSCVLTIKTRDVVAKLMENCEKISKELAHTVLNLKESKQPSILDRSKKLTKYQLIGLNWLVLMYNKRLNGILADEMGLGKTIQVIALLAYLWEKHHERGPHLIIVPASTLDNWIRELQDWCDVFKVLCYHGSQEDRKIIRNQVLLKQLDFNVMITTYSLVYNNDDRIIFKKMEFTYVVFDEAHMLKNMRSSRFQNLMNIKADFRLLLTGTPLQNNLVELMSLLIFTMPRMFSGKIKDIERLFSSNKEEEREEGKASYEQERIDQAKKIMKPFILRRLKSEVLSELPQKIEIVQKIAMEQYQREKYSELIESYTREMSHSVKDNEKELNVTTKRSVGMLMNLRKVANHPLLIRTYYTTEKLKGMAKLMLNEPTHHDANPDLILEDMEILNDFDIHSLCKKFSSISSFKLGNDLMLDSGKFMRLDEILPTLKMNGQKVLIFSQFVMMLDIIEVYLNIRQHKFIRLDGSTKVTDRIMLIDQFKETDDIFVFLLSTRAGGLGINLTIANTVIIHDIDFNPYNDKQAEDRCHRIGQTQEVSVYRLISENSVEEGMLHICNEKLKLGRDICETETGEAKHEEQKDVKTLLRQVLGL